MKGHEDHHVVQCLNASDNHFQGAQI